MSESSRKARNLFVYSKCRGFSSYISQSSVTADVVGDYIKESCALPPTEVRRLGHLRRQRNEIGRKKMNRSKKLVVYNRSCKFKTV